ncbi:MAG TPA: hypothetical protein DCZ95_11335 [Verrucomicrobia bacterium]|nr:MAG: hypothetical protein A2X46_04260 [Lentisphaerae bacterium GWF2_57_35]HBA84678.1 hypothetical protein [Verrucomicrobiota bacterium]
MKAFLLWTWLVVGTISMAEDPPRAPAPDVNLGVSREIEGAARPPPPAFLKPGRPLFSVSANLQYTPRSDVDENGRIEINRQGYSVGLAIPDKAGRMVGLAFDQEYSQYRFKNIDDEFLNDLFDDISVSRMTLTYRWKVNEKWSAFAAADMTCSVESGADWEKGLTGGGIASFRRQVATNFAYSVGLFLRKRLEEDPLGFPIPGIEWQITKRLGLRTAQGVTFDYALDERKRWVMDLAGRYEGREFRLDKDGPISDGVVADRRVPVLLGAHFRPNPGMQFHLYGGWIAWQEYKTMDEDGNGLSVVKTDANLVGGASASLRF